MLFSIWATFRLLEFRYKWIMGYKSCDWLNLSFSLFLAYISFLHNYIRLSFVHSFSCSLMHLCICLFLLHWFAHSFIINVFAKCIYLFMHSSLTHLTPANTRHWAIVVQCWSTGYDADPTLNQQWLNVSCLQGLPRTNTSTLPSPRAHISLHRGRWEDVTAILYSFQPCAQYWLNTGPTSTDVGLV